MKKLDYYELKLPKSFKRYDCGHFPGYNYCSHDFYDNYVHGELNDTIPIDNPLKKAIFYDTKTQFDLYKADVLGVNRGFLIKEHAYALLQEFNLAEHVAYPGVIHEFEGKKYDDLVFVYFYKDYGKRIDYANSIYWILKEYYFNYDRETETIYDYVVQDDIRLSSLEEFDSKRINLWEKRKLKLRIKYLYCPEATKYDVFGFEEFSSGVYLSGPVKEAFKKNKIKGVDYAGNMYFQFMIL